MYVCKAYAGIKVKVHGTCAGGELLGSPCIVLLVISQIRSHYPIVSAIASGHLGRQEI